MWLKRVSHMSDNRLPRDDYKANKKHRKTPSIACVKKTKKRVYNDLGTKLQKKKIIYIQAHNKIVTLKIRFDM